MVQGVVALILIIIDITMLTITIIIIIINSYMIELLHDNTIPTFKRSSC